MKKDKKSGLKSEDTKKGVAEESKNISKKQKKFKSKADVAAKCAIHKTVNENLSKNDQSFKKEKTKDKSLSDGKQAGLDFSKKKTKKKKEGKVQVKSINNENQNNEDGKVLSEKDLAKIAKKKAKKLAQKLKKKEMKATLKENDDKPSKNNKVSIKEVNGEKSSAANKPESVGNKSPGKVQKAGKKKHNKNEDEKESKNLKLHGPEVDAATIFVGNLPVNTKRVQLLRVFKEYGPVHSIRFRAASGKVMFKHKQRKEAGSLNAWIVLKDAEAAERALAINGTVFKNNHLRVTKAKMDNANAMDVKRTIFVGNLKYSATEEKLREIFSSCGDIDYVRCLRDGEKGCKGVAYVCFKTPDAVGLSLELNETMLDERPINVERYSVKKLGAKEKRDEAAKNENHSKTGKKRFDSKKKTGKPLQQSKQTDGAKEKKSKFRGVKVDNLKKKQKKKQNSSQMQKLAKKIAPKQKDA